MQKRVVYWKREHYSELGYDLVELLEDGTVLKRRFKNQEENNHYYSEQSNKSFQAKGEIRIEKVRFDENNQLKEDSVKEHLEIIETYSFNDWQEAREQTRQLQKECEDDLSVDVHSVIAFEASSLPGDVASLLDRFEFPIIKFRIIHTGGYIKRKKHPEQVSIEFVPTLNERLYFHHIPSTKHLNITGDDLFSLHTQTTKHIISDEEFWDYIHTKIKEVTENEKFYRELINKQRERRAMLETDVIGDLYPR